MTRGTWSRAAGVRGARRFAGYAAELATRLYELVLVGVGLAFILTADPVEDLGWLVIWDTLALVYLVTGAARARRSRLAGHDAEPASARPWPVRLLTGRRFSFLFTFSASATGMYAAATVVVQAGSRDSVADHLAVFAVAATVLAWTLLHTGYARFYAALCHRDRTGIQFPGTADPGRVDLLYFAFTIGTSFAVSDATVTSRELRWHVTVHSILSFFYNAAVLAIAIQFVTGGLSG